MAENVIMIKNYNCEYIQMDFEPLQEFALLQSYDFSLIQGFCRKALQDPVCVFAKDGKELYCTMIGKNPSGFYLLVSKNDEGKKSIEQIKFYPSVYEAKNIAQGWDLIYFMEK